MNPGLPFLSLSAALLTTVTASAQAEARGGDSLHRSQSSRSKPTLPLPLLVLTLFLFGIVPAEAARIGDIGEIDAWEQIQRFLSLRDPAVRYALLGSVLLGLTCGTLGSFIVVRRLALMGDTLSHAVLPGVVLGFLWNMTKDPIAIFVGATLAGLAGTLTVSFITQTTRLKEDAALGMVLAGYFAVGATLLTMTQRLPSGTQSGINDFLFGQAAEIGPNDLWLMGIVTVIVVALLTLFYKEFLISSFDAGFAHLVGIPAKLVHHVLMLLLAFAVVISLQAVGVVLVSAMLIIPAATGYLLTERLSRMIVLASLIGVASGVTGAFLSFLGNNLPTGPFMVLAAGAFFFTAFLFSPRHGVGIRAFRQMARGRRISRENTLKGMYHVLEKEGFKTIGVSLRELAEHHRETLEETRSRVLALKRAGLASLSENRHVAHLTPQGWKRAATIVRNHRLWELYLTNAVELAPDHVHDDAEKIEHILGEDTVRLLERRLGHATIDPHGKAIPSTIDIHQGRIPGDAPSQKPLTGGPS